MPRLERNYTRTRERVDRTIRNTGMQAVLRRAGIPDRPVSITIQEYDARERMGKLIDPIDRLCIMSALDPITGDPMAILPDREQDRLITFVQPVSIPPIEF